METPNLLDLAQAKADLSQDGLLKIKALEIAHVIMGEGKGRLSSEWWPVCVTRGWQVAKMIQHWKQEGHIFFRYHNARGEVRKAVGKRPMAEPWNPMGKIERCMMVDYWDVIKDSYRQFRIDKLIDFEIL